jgi:nitrate/TMAO reductase-like tetraheme cytochrome c subunit
MSEEAQAAPGGEEKESPKKVPGLFRNYISFIGAAIVIASLASIVLLFLIETTGASNNPYLGIFTYILFPAFLAFGLLVILFGMLRERRRRRKLSPSEIAAYPKLDLNNPRSRRNFFAFLGLSFVFIFMTVFGSYRAYEYTESVAFCGQACHVMKPEYTAFQASPHARLRCVDCHVGPGPGGYVRSKFAGVRQLYGVVFNKYSKPIPTPVHNMPAANETCAHCHWPEKFYGQQLKVLNHYAYDEQNTFRQTRLLINVGGGSPMTGQVSGIHWHMNIANEVTYIATDEQRQTIPWVQVKDRQGNVTEYMSRRSAITPEQVAQLPRRRMDCIDCHNRPAHIYQPPDVAVDRAFAAGRLDASLPYLKRQAIEALNKPYNSTDEAVNSIANSMDGFYRTNYQDVYSQRGNSIRGAIAEVQRIYQTYFFPEMKTDWRTHPNNIGHLYSSGCFRCHDGEHVSSTGKVIRNDCNICHTVLAQDEVATTPEVQGKPFVHPVNLGDLAELNCAVCHQPNKPFVHPVNLGDISQFQCADCHTGKRMRRAS